MTTAASLPPRRLRLQVQVVSFLLIVGLALGCGEWLARQRAAVARDTAGETLLRTARDMADRLSQEMAARARDVQALATSTALQDGLAGARPLLDRMQAAAPQFSWIGVADPTGTVVAATGDLLVGRSIAERPVFRQGRERLWTGDVHEAVMLAKLLPQPPGEDIKFVDIAAPLRNPAGEVVGVLATHLSWQWADSLRETVLRPRGAAGALQLAVVAGTGQLLLPPAKGAPDLTLPAMRAAELTERWSLESWNDGRSALTAVAESRPLGDFRGFGWRVVVRDTAATQAASLDATRPRFWAWSLAAGSLLALALWPVIGRRVPLRTSPEPARTQPATLLAGAVRPQQRRTDAPATRPHALPLPIPASADGRDPLTGLGNADQLRDWIERTSAAAPAEPFEACVLSVEVDGFDALQDRYGRAAHDEVLVQVARRLRQASRADDNVFRTGGDAFLILLTCPAGEGATLTRTVGTRVLTELQRPLSYRTLSNVRVNGSVGGAVWPLHGETLAQAVAHSGEALLAARRSGPGKFRLHAGTAAGDPARVRA